MTLSFRFLTAARYFGVGMRRGSRIRYTLHCPFTGAAIWCSFVLVHVHLSFFALSHGQSSIIHHPSVHCVQHAASTACTSPGVHSASVMQTPILLLISYRPICFPVQFSFIRVTVQHAQKDPFSFKVFLCKRLQFQIRSSWLNKR